MKRSNARPQFGMAGSHSVPSMKRSETASRMPARRTGRFSLKANDPVSIRLETDRRGSKPSSAGQTGSRLRPIVHGYSATTIVSIKTNIVLFKTIHYNRLKRLEGLARMSGMD
ncbi:MAG: hypothetical protein Q4A16_05295 [Lautropia sp.]|nr:hypothetical protein [Lautropia sp.]